MAVETREAVTPHGHYSQAVRCGPLVFISGILGNNSDLPAEEVPGLDIQVLDCLRQIEAIAKAAGSCRRLIARVGIFVTGAASWPKVNSVYAGYFGAHRPARIIVPVSELRLNSLVEMDAVAVVGPTESARSGPGPS